MEEPNFCPRCGAKIFDFWIDDKAECKKCNFIFYVQEADESYFIGKA